MRRVQRTVGRAFGRAGSGFLDAFSGACVALVVAGERVGLTVREAGWRVRPAASGVARSLDSAVGGGVRRVHPAVFGAIIAGAVSFGISFAVGAGADRASPSRLAASRHAADDQRPRVALGAAPALRVRDALLQPVVTAPPPRPKPKAAPAPRPTAPVTTPQTTTASPQTTVPQTTTPQRTPPTPRPTAPAPKPRAAPAPKPKPKPKPAPKPQAKPAPKKAAPPDFDSTGPPAPQSDGSG